MASLDRNNFISLPPEPASLSSCLSYPEMMKRKTKNAIVNLFLLLLFLYVSGRILYYSLPVSPTSAAIRSKTSKKLVRSSTGPPPPPSVFIRLFPFLSYWFVGRDVNAKNRQYYEMDLGDTTSLSSDHHQRGANSISSTTTSTAKDDEDGDSSPASSVSAAIVYVIPSDLGTGGIKRLYASIRHLFFYFNNDGRYVRIAEQS